MDFPYHQIVVHKFVFFFKLDVSLWSFIRLLPNLSEIVLTILPSRFWGIIMSKVSFLIFVIESLVCFISVRIHFASVSSVVRSKWQSRVITLFHIFGSQFLYIFASDLLGVFVFAFMSFLVVRSPSFIESSTRPTIGLFTCTGYVILAHWTFEHLWLLLVFLYFLTFFLF